MNVPKNIFFAHALCHLISLIPIIFIFILFISCLMLICYLSFPFVALLSRTMLLSLLISFCAETLDDDRVLAAAHDNRYRTFGQPVADHSFTSFAFFLRYSSVMINLCKDTDSALLLLSKYYMCVYIYHYIYIYII